MTLVNGTNLTFKNVLIAGGTEQARRPKTKTKSKPKNKAEKRKAEETKNEKQKADAIEALKPKLNAKLAMVESIPPNSQVKITFGDSQQLIDKYRALPLMTNARRTAEQLWDDKFKEAKSVPVEWLADLPELKDKWTQYANWFSLRLNDNSESEVARSVFVTAYEQFNPNSAVSLGRMFDCVFDNLKLDMNEYRMFASTDEKLGQTKIDPSSTQTDRQTLVVAHLTRPNLPKIRRDSNSASDLKVVSDLDSKKAQNTIEMFE